MDMKNTATYIYEEFKRRKVKVEVIDESSGLMRYRHSGSWHRLRGCVAEGASSVSVFICNNKPVAEQIAKDIGMPVPVSQNYQSFDQAMKFVDKYSSIVVKPADSAHGHGISLDVSSKSALKKALSRAKKYSKKPPLLQQMVQGQDVRMMIIDGKYVAAVRRVPATVVGDGKHTLGELIEIENRRPIRTSSWRGQMRVISLEAAKSYLRRRVSKIPAKGDKVPVVGMSNTSIGGHAEDMTDQLPSTIYKKAEKFVRELGLPVCGVDILLDDSGKYHFIEANASPGFGPHHNARIGQKRDVTKLFVDMLLEK